MSGASVGEPLRSDNLAVLLPNFSDADLDQLAEVVVAAAGGGDRLGRRQIKRERRQGLSGKLLVPAIINDLTLLASHETGRRPTYAEIVREVAERHGKEQPHGDCVELERRIQMEYGADLRPPPATFEERGASSIVRRVLYAVPPFGPLAYAASPKWSAVTRIVLEISALRRIALVQALRRSLQEVAP